MRKKTKIWLIIAASLVVLGGVLFTGVMFKAGWNFREISTTKYETNTYEISEDFEDISIDTDTADITFALSDDGKCRIVCFEEEKSKHQVTVEESTLVINEKVEKDWYDYIGINFGSPKLSVYLPKTQYNSIFIKESTGDISIADLSANSLDLNLSTGDVTLSNVGCKILASNANTGDICLKNVIASKKLTIKRSTGDVKFIDSDAWDISVETNTGDVEGSLLTSKVFVTETDTGKIDVPKTTSGGKCEITTSTGNIKITVKN